MARNRWALVAALSAALIPCGASTQVGSTTYTYDDLGRLSIAAFDNGSVIHYSYDAAGNRTQYEVKAQAPIVSPVTAVLVANSLNNPISLIIMGAAAISVAVPPPGAQNGTTSVSGTTLTYSPNTGFVGTDSFQYTATNPVGTSAAAGVTITINGSVTPAPITWDPISAYDTTATVSGSNPARTFTGISQTITLSLVTLNATGGGTLGYSKNAGAWTTWTSGVTIAVANNDTLAFRVSRNTIGHSQGSIQVVNQSNANAVINQFTYDVQRDVNGCPTC
jgi:hypothetical protein